MAQQCFYFISNYNKSYKLLNSVLDNLADTLSVLDEDSLSGNQFLYIITDEVQSKILLIEDQTEEEKKIRDDKVLKYLKGEFTDEDQLAEVLSAHDKIQCPECAQSRKSLHSLKEHYDKCHCEYICQECGKNLKGLDKLKQHETSHFKMECPKCGKVYLTKDFYVKHTKLCLEGKWDPHPFRDTKEYPYTCKKCGKGYSTAGGLRVHNRFVHGDAKGHVCQWCNKSFTAPSYLKVHLVTHTGEKNFKCNTCGRGFVSKEALVYHTRRHTGEKPYSCKLCKEKFVNASARADHIKFKHVGPTLMCELCSRKFVTKYFLTKHFNKHYDPTSKLYVHRGPPDVPSLDNMKVKQETPDLIQEDVLQVFE